MGKTLGKIGRVFKTAWFFKAAKRALIQDSELCSAIQQVALGQADDLGGGVFKKRLHKNMHRAIILAASSSEDAQAGRYWVFAYLFAKKDRANIQADELVAFRKLAKSYATLDEQQITQLLRNEDFTEICHDDETQVQE